MQCRMFNSTPGLYPQGAIAFLPHPLGVVTTKMSSDTVNVLWEAKSSQVENHCSKKTTGPLHTMPTKTRLFIAIPNFRIAGCSAVRTVG